MAPGSNLQHPLPRRGRSLALELVQALGDRIRSGVLAPSTRLPPESAVMAEFGVSRTVVREALSRLQAAGQVVTRHGIGTFVVGPSRAQPFSVDAQHLATLQDVVALLELRLGVETEACYLASQRRSEHNLSKMQGALSEFAQHVKDGREAVAADVSFHLEISRATQNDHYARLMEMLGSGMIPRARLDPTSPKAVMTEDRRDYLLRVNSEHLQIFDAIAARDGDAARAAMRMHLVNSRERRRRAVLAVAAA